MATIKHLQGTYMGISNAIIQEIKVKMRDFTEVHVEHEKRENNVWLLNTPKFICMPHSILNE